MTISQVSETETDGRRSIRSITGLRRDSEIMFGGTMTPVGNHQRGKISNVFPVEDEDGQDEENEPRKSGLIR